MNKYILTGQAIGIGGWQLYCDARIAYLSDLGYEVYLIHSAGDNENASIKLSAFDKKKMVYIDEIKRCPASYTRKQLKKVNEAIKSAICYSSSDDQIFIESTSMTHAMWGEIIAEDLNGIHFSYLLQSHFEVVPDDIKAFFAHKYEQELLGGMTNKTLSDLFGDYISLDKKRLNGMKAAGRGSLTVSNEYDSLLTEIKRSVGDNGKVIGYFGTLNKPHFKEVCNQITNYIKGHNDVKFCFMSVGSSRTGDAEVKQSSMERNLDNIRTVNIPELYPVPKSIFTCMDVCIGSWGSAIVAARAGVKTVRLMDDVDVLPQGIIGYTIKCQPYHECKYESRPLSQWLDEVLFSNVFLSEDFVPPEPSEDYRIVHARNDQIIRPFVERQGCYDYYNTKKLCYNKRHTLITKLCNAILGEKVTTKLLTAYYNSNKA